MKVFSDWRLNANIFIFITMAQFAISQRNIERRIITSDKLAAPIARLSHGVLVDNTLYISGFVGLTQDGNLVDGLTNQTKVALDNIGHVLEAAGVTYNHGMDD